MFSLGWPSAARAFFNCASTEKSPQPGHHRTSWSLVKSLDVSDCGCAAAGAARAAAGSPPAGTRDSFSFPIPRSPFRLQKFVDLRLDLANQKRPALHLIQTDRVGEVGRT